MTVGKPQIIKAVNTLWFSGISPDLLFAISGVGNFFRYPFIAHALLIDFIKHLKGFVGFVYQAAKESGRIVCITEIQPESRLNGFQLADFLNIKGFFFPILIDKPFNNAPICLLYTSFIIASTPLKTS